MSLLYRFGNGHDLLASVYWFSLDDVILSDPIWYFDKNAKQMYMHNERVALILQWSTVVLTLQCRKRVHA